MLKDFKVYDARNVLDLAVGVIIGRSVPGWSSPRL
jgi:large-conductance mechanosensitive channel